MMKNPKKMINRFLLLLISSCGIVSFAQENKESSPPNIIIFLVDDMGLMDTSVPFIADSEGNPKRYPLNDFYRTPNMEKLAAQGIRFSNFYAHSVCSPTRVSIMTGQNSARHRTTTWIRSESNNRTEFGPSDWNWKGLDKKSVTLPGILEQDGYRTIHVGKAHFGPLGYEGEDPLNLGFDVNIAGSSIGQPGSYYGTEGFGNTGGNKSRAVPGLKKYWGRDIFLTEALTLEANAAISQAKKDDKPFYLYMAHYAVHSPFQSDPRFADHYKDSGKNKKAQAYATLIEGIDKSLGDIVSHVRNLGLGENTLILFMGDNGSDAPVKTEHDYGSSFPLKGKKGKHWEGGMRVPFITAWITPDNQSSSQKRLPIPQGTVQGQMGSILDLFPTISNLVGATIPERYVLDGFDLGKQLDGGKNTERDESFLNHFPHAHRTDYFTSWVKDDWKVVYHYQVEGNPQYELFDLGEDPFEITDLADAKPKRLKNMVIDLTDQLKEKGALYPEKEGIPLKVIVP